MRDSKAYSIFSSVTPQSVTSSTDATPIVVTKASHGLTNGTLVLIQGHTTNVAANGIFKIANVATNTFELTDYNSGANIAGSGAGAGSSGIVMAAPKIAFTQDFVNAELSVITAGTATTTLKVAGSQGKLNEDTPVPGNDTPNFGATQSKTNPYTFLEIIDLDDETPVVGSTGIVVAGADINKTYEVNVNGIKYLTVLPVTWTAGAITVQVRLYTRN